MLALRRVRPRLRPREAVFIAASGLAMFGLFCLVRQSLIDDSYITLAYAKNLALHLHWGVVPQEFANTATSPLNVGLLGALTAVTRIGGGVHPVIALGAMSVALAMVMAWGWVRVARVWRLPSWVAALGVTVVVVNPILLSSVGLEVLLIPALLILALAMALEERPVWFGVIAGLMLLARPDLVVFVVVMAAASPAVRRRWPRALAAAIGVAAPWFLFSWIFFGSALPDTFAIKTAQHLPGFDFIDGPALYFTNRPSATAVAALPAVAGLAALIVWAVGRTSVRWKPAERIPAIGPAAGLAIGGIAYYLLFVVLNVPAYHWYYVPPLVSLSMFLVLAAGVWLERAREHPRLRTAIPAAVLGLAGLLVVLSLARDLAIGVPWRTPAITTNFASKDDYARVGLALRKRVGTATVQNNGEIGTVAFFCACDLVEQFSDRRQVIPLIDEQTSSRSGLLKRLFFKSNYLWLDRNQKPTRQKYLLRYHAGPATGPVAWKVTSRSSFFKVPIPGHVTLLPFPR